MWAGAKVEVSYPTIYHLHNLYNSIMQECYITLLCNSGIYIAVKHAINHDFFYIVHDRGVI